VVGALAPSWSIRGRAAELAVLRDALDRVESGRLAMVLLEGEAGIGKTRLLDHALQDAKGRGLQVLAGRAGELERTRPFGVVAGIFGVFDRRRIRGGLRLRTCSPRLATAGVIRSRSPAIPDCDFGWWMRSRTSPKSWP
jgi:hypothetical protein